MEEQTKLYSKWNELLLRATYVPNIIKPGSPKPTLQEAEKWVLEAGKLEREFINLKRQTFTFLIK